MSLMPARPRPPPPPQAICRGGRTVGNWVFLGQGKFTVYFHKIPLSKWFLKTILLGRREIYLIICFMDEETSFKRLNNCCLSTVMVELGLELSIDCTLL